MINKTTPEVVLYETAMLAMKKGFNWMNKSGFEDPSPALVYAYNKKKRIYECKSIEFVFDNSVDYKIDSHSCAAPSQVVLERYLREEQKINIVIQPSSDIDKNTFTYSYNIVIWKNFVMILPNSFPTYEEAVEAAIIHGLNLI